MATSKAEENKNNKEDTSVKKKTQKKMNVNEHETEN